jgi:peroxiredoxin
MPEQETLESRLAALRSASAERNPQTARLHKRLIAELAGWIVPEVRQVGDQAPDFELRSAADDKPIRLSWMLDVGPVIISFYRGFWCPYSNVQLAELARAYAEIRGLGAVPLFVGPETRANAAKMRAKWESPVPVLYDSDGRTMDAFRVAYEMPEYLRDDYRQLGFPNLNPGTGWRLPVPATFLIDQLGVIRARHVDADFTRRAEPADIIAALKRLRSRIAA